jgi:S-adenosylmethionine hydrolase
VARLAPGAPRVDLAHDLPAHDVRAGALLLWRVAPWLAPGVVLAVVDPGVGTARRAVAVDVDSVGGPLSLVGPDNGLLLPAALAAGRITAAVELAPPARRPPGATFAGRDLFAPAAGRLAAGTPIGELGAPIDPATLTGDAVPSPDLERTLAEGAHGVVLWVDHFGNAQLNVTPAHLTELGPDLVAELPGGRAVPVRVAATYEELGPGTLGLVTDSYGWSALSLDRASAAATYGLAPGDRVTVRAAGRFP